MTTLKNKKNKKIHCDLHHDMMPLECNVCENAVRKGYGYFVPKKIKTF
jgi:hypothetical protein